MIKYKNLIPVLLVLLMVFGIYNTFTTAAEQKDTKEENLALARENREKGVIQDALTYYQAALAEEDDFFIRLEIGEMLTEAGMLSDAQRWGEKLIERFPKEAQGYTFLLERYLEEADYEECFQLNDQAVNTGCADQRFQELMASIAYSFDYEFATYEEATTFSAGFAAARPKKEEWIIISDAGNITARGYLQTGYYNGEVVPLLTEEGWMFATADGNKKIDVSGLTDCQELGTLNGEAFLAKCGGLYGYYNVGLEELAGGFEAAANLNQGIGAARKDGQWLILDTTGKELTPKRYQDVRMNARNAACANERIWVSEDQLHYYMIDMEGGRIEGSEVDDSKGFTVDSSFAAVKKDGKWGFMDKDGGMAIKPQYEDARSFCNGYAAVRQNGEWGFINEEGAMAIEPQFEAVMDFSAGSVFVKQDGLWRLLKLYRNNY